MSKLQYLIHFDILFYVKSTFTTFKSDVPLSQTLKHIVMKTIKLFRTVLLLILFITSKSIWSQENKLAIFDLHSINIMYKGEEITRLLRMEATKMEIYTVMDSYEMAEIYQEKKKSPLPCYSSKCAISNGELLSVQFATVGSIEKFGEKIIIQLSLIDVKNQKVMKQMVQEFIDKEEEIQRMLRVSIQKLISDNVESQLLAELTYIETPVKNPNNLVNLNGPRMGFSFITGDAAARLSANEDEGGFEMLGSNDAVFTTTMGYQWEKRYLATNDFQALVEGIVLIGGMEVGQLNPSITFINGIRFSKSNIEIGFGPNLKFKRVANGYFDESGKWKLSREWDNTLGENPYPIQRDVLDKRGDLALDLGMVFAVGKTFQSGRLNIPVNIFYAPKRNSSLIGVSLGFNLQKMN